MADIRLVKPQANTAQTVSCAADSRFVLEFPSDAALFARDGDDLVLTFEDGSSIRLQDFYTTYSKEEMPSFEMQGAEISGEDFFAALGNPDLMPAAGPTASAATRGGGFNQYGDAALLEGIGRLDGLDIGFNWGEQTQDDLYASIGRDDDEGTVDHGVTVVPTEPGTLDPSIPVVDDPENSGGNSRPGANNSILIVSETGLDGENLPSASGSMQVTAPDGVGSIVIKDTTIFENGRPVLDEDGDPAKVWTDEGYLTATYDPSTGVLDYTYTLTQATQEHKKPGQDDIARNLEVTVTDTDGDSASSTITVVIGDDVYAANDDSITITEGEDTTVTGNVVTDEGEGRDDPGADGLGRVEWDTETVEGGYTLTLDEDGDSYTVTLGNETVGSLTLDENGGYSFTLDKDYDVTNKTPDLVIGYTGYDKDEDYDKAQLTIKIEPDTNEPEIVVPDPEKPVGDNPGLTDDSQTVDEAYRPGGSKNETEENLATTQGTFTVTTNGETSTLTINDETIALDANGNYNGTSVTVTTDYGTLTVTSVQNGTVHYTYELTNAPTVSGSETEDNFKITVEDATHDKAESELTINILDDVYAAENDTASVTEGEKWTVTGNVVTDEGEGKDTPGADGLGRVEWDTETVEGGYTLTAKEGGSYTVSLGGETVGILTLDDKGGYIFTLDEDYDVTEKTPDLVIGYTGYDKDEDSDSAKLTIKIEPDTNEPELEITTPATGDANIMVDEGALVGSGSGQHAEHGAGGNGSFKVDLHGEDGTITLSHGGKVVVLTVEDGNGTVPQDAILTVNGVEVTVEGLSKNTDGQWVVSYSYALKGNQTHKDIEATGEADALSGVIDIRVEDATGDEAPGSLSVSVHDDGPLVTNISNSVTVRFGADDDTRDENKDSQLAVEVFVGNEATGTPIVWGDNGTDLSALGDNDVWTSEDDSITVHKENGNLVFQLKENSASTTIHVQATDSDGDTDGLTVQLTNPTITPGTATPGAGDNAIVVDEALLTDGNEEQHGDGHEPTGEGSFTVNLNGENGTITLKNGTQEVSLSVQDKKEFTDLTGKELTVNGVRVTISEVTQDSDGQWTVKYNYELLGQQTHPVEGQTGSKDELSNTIDIVVKDASGDRATGSISVAVHDDGPVLNNVSVDHAQITDSVSDITGQLNGLSIGADSVGATITVEVGGTTFHGTLDGAGKWVFKSENSKDGEKFSLQGDGKFAYSRPTADLADKDNETYEIKVTVTDSDGDSVTQEVTVNSSAKPAIVPGDPEHPEGPVDILVTDDSGLSDGNHEDPDKNDGVTSSNVAEGSFSVELNGQGYTLVITGSNGSSQTLHFYADGQLEGRLPSSVVQGSHGTLAITDTSVSDDGKLTVEYTYTQTRPFEHTPDAGKDQAQNKADGFTVEVTDDLGQFDTGSIDVTIEDDAPVVTVTTGETTSVPGKNLSDGTKTTFSDFDNNSHKYTGDVWNDLEDNSSSITICDGQVTITAGIVDSDGSNFNSDGCTLGQAYTEDNNVLENNDLPRGLTVNSNQKHNYEIGYDPITGKSEALEFQLDGLAYGINLELSGFWAAGTGSGDASAEQLRVLFYRGNELLNPNSQVLSSDSKDGVFGVNGNFQEFISQGFDRVVIYAVNNGENWDNSDFLLSSVEFITQPEAMYTTSGTVTAQSGADGFDQAYDGNPHVEFADKDGNVFEDQGKITLYDQDGTFFEVTLSIQEGTSGEDKILTANREESGEQKPVFSINLDQNGSWTFNQYEEFYMDSSNSENTFEFGFVTEDGDGDKSFDTAVIKTNTIIETDSNNNDSMILEGSAAGLIVTGDSHDTTVTTREEFVVSDPKNYNICFLLDTSESMDATITDDKNRYDISIDAINNYIQSIIDNDKYIGTATIHIIPFDNIAHEGITITIEKQLEGGKIKTEIHGEWDEQNNAIISNFELDSGTNYADAFKTASEWFEDLGSSNDAENITYFLTDGFMNKSNKEDGKGGDKFDAVEDARNNFDDLKEQCGTIHAIGIGGGEEDALTGDAMTSLDMFDTTENTSSKHDGIPGVIYFDTIGDKAYLTDPEEVKDINSYQDMEKYLTEHEGTYFVHISKGKGEDGDTWYAKITQNEEGKWGFTYYISEDEQYFMTWDSENKCWKDENKDKKLYNTKKNTWLYTQGEDTSDIGSSQKVTSGDELASALEDGLVNVTRPAFEELSDDRIDASNSETAVNTIYGDVLFTDNLDDADTGSGYDAFKDWSDEKITQYIHDNSQLLGSETVLHPKDEKGGYDSYYRDVYGQLHEKNGALVTDEKLDDISNDLISREGGNDTIFGTQTGDSIFGQEGDDILFGDGNSETLSALMQQLEIQEESSSASEIASAIKGKAEEDSENLNNLISEINDVVEGGDNDGNDQLYGGSGDDLLFGMGGDDYLVGGLGSDILFGGAGNDIVVYDKEDFMVSGGSGIDFMVTTDDTVTLDALLTTSGRDGKGGPIVEGIEVLLKGEDALSLTNMEQLASKYNITVEDNEIRLGEGWSKQGTDNNTYIFYGNDDTPQLTMEFNPGDKDQLQVILNQAETGSV